MTGEEIHNDTMIDPEALTSQPESSVFDGADRRKTLIDLGQCLFEKGRPQLMWEVLLNTGVEHLAKDARVLEILCESTDDSIRSLNNT